MTIDELEDLAWKIEEHPAHAPIHDTEPSPAWILAQGVIALLKVVRAVEKSDAHVLKQLFWAQNEMHMWLAEVKSS